MSRDSFSDNSFVDDFNDDEELKTPLKLREKGNAGVKGVLNDYEEARKHAELRLKDRIAETKRIIEGKQPIVEESTNELDELDELEKELFGEVISAKVFKERQKTEVMKKIIKRTYGDVRELDEESYIDTITKLEDDVFAVIHIYTTFVKDCKEINRLLEEYAPRFQNVCFCRITWEDSNRPFPETALPAILLYKGDVLVKSIFGKEAVPFMMDIFPGLID
ncbi:Phosducin-like protein [Entamoeba marina]